MEKKGLKIQQEFAEYMDAYDNHYQALMKKQNEVCAICERQDKYFLDYYTPADCLLCTSCHIGMDRFNHSKFLLFKAAGLLLYATKPSED